MRKKIEKSSSSNKTVRVWDFRTRAAIRVLSDHTNYVFGRKAISSTSMASASEDNTVRIWKSTSRALIKTLTSHIAFIRWSLDLLNESVLVSGSGDGRIKIWNVPICFSVYLK